MPPAVVPALEDSKPKDRPSTVREQLELHRANPDVRVVPPEHWTRSASRSKTSMPSASGRTTTIDGLPIDAAGILADGTAVDGPVELRAALLAKPEVFAGTVTEKLLIYALGRGLEPADMPVVRSILRNAAKDEYRLIGYRARRRRQLAVPDANQAWRTRRDCKRTAQSEGVSICSSPKKHLHRRTFLRGAWARSRCRSSTRWCRRSRSRARRARCASARSTCRTACTRSSGTRRRPAGISSSSRS